MPNMVPIGVELYFVITVIAYEIFNFCREGTCCFAEYTCGFGAAGLYAAGYGWYRGVEGDSLQ